MRRRQKNADAPTGVGTVRFEGTEIMVPLYDRADGITGFTLRIAHGTEVAPAIGETAAVEMQVVAVRHEERA